MLDKMIGAALQGMLGGAGQQAASPALGGGLMEIAMKMLAGGGLQNILQQFQQAGLGQQAQSWVSTGANLPISPEDLMKVFGQGQMAQWAQQLGVPQEEAAGGLSAMLPELINQVTPQGQVPATNDLDGLLAGLTRSLGR